MNNLNQPITPRQLAVLKAIAFFEKNRCYSATIAELAIRLNVSRTTVFEHIAALRGKKLLSGTKGKARSLKLTRQANRLLDEIDQTEEFDNNSATSGTVPLLGDVAAGNPIDAIENRQMLSLTSVFGDGDDIFALEVHGDSMINAGIDSGDFVLCKRTPNAEDGDMVVAILDEDTATVKRFFRDENQIRLEPANDSYQPIYTDNCRIEGVVLGTMRKF